MNSDFWAHVLFDVLVAVALVVVVAAVFDTRRSRRTRGGVVKALAAVVLVVAGLGLTVVPVTASTGAICSISPTTAVMGSAGAQENVNEAPDDTDRTSVQSCIDKARRRTAGGIGLVLIGAVGYTIGRRSGTRERNDAPARS